MIKVFLSYSHKDEALQKELNEHLGALKHEKIIETWSDQQIPASSNWSEDIARKLDAADLILLLVSSAFLDSAYCYAKEMRRAIERHESGDARVVPIILRPCHWEPAPFSKLQGLPKNMTPVTDVPEDKRDVVWAEVAKGVHQAAMLCSTRKGSDDNQTNAHATITITGIVSVDEEQLNSIVEHYKKGDKFEIKWPKSSDELLSLVRQVVKKFDEENIHSVGSEEFIASAPAAIANTLSRRAKCEKQLPELMGRLSDFGEFKDDPKHSEHNRKCKVDAIKFYLLRAHFIAHWKLGYLSSWEGLSRLNLKAPNAWIRYQGLSDDEFYAQLYRDTLYRETSPPVMLRLYKIGDHKCECRGGRPYINIRVPSYGVVNSTDSKQYFLKRLVGQVIYQWGIPEVELDGDLESLPDTYNGTWVVSEG
jgi:hypothetical protein